MTIKLYWALWALAATLFTLFPEIDLWVSDRFTRPFDLFWLGHREPFETIRDLVPIVTWATLATILLLPLAPRLIARLGRDRPWLTRLPVPRLGGRAVWFVLLSFALGPGLLVNVVLKDHWGRARPTQVTFFGGEKQFTPALRPTNQCDRNCSFVAGDPSVGFALLSVALLVAPRRRRVACVAAIGVGALIGLTRIVQGGHFLSDVVFSGLITTGVVWFLHTMIMARDGPARIGEAIARWQARAGEILFAPGIPLTRRLVWAAAALGIVELVLILGPDQMVARAVHAAHPVTRALFQSITNIGLGGPWFILTGLMLAGGWLAMKFQATFEGERLWRERLKVPLYFLACLATAGIANTVIKFILGRTRPTLLFNGEHYGFDLFQTAGSHSSFPSGHAETMFTVATALTLIWPRHVIAYYLVALVIATSRVMTGAHYPSDVLAGAFLGAATALLLHRGFFKRSD